MSVIYHFRLAGKQLIPAVSDNRALVKFKLIQRIQVTYEKFSRIQQKRNAVITVTGRMDDLTGDAEFIEKSAPFGDIEKTDLRIIYRFIVFPVFFFEDMIG